MEKEREENIMEKEKLLLTHGWEKVLVDLKRALNRVFYCNKNTGQKELNGRRDPSPPLMETALIFFSIFLEYFPGVLLPIRYTGSEVFLTTVVLAED